MNIDIAIEKSRPTKACALCVRFSLDKDGQCKHCHTFVDEFGSYERNALVELKRLGITDLETLFVQSWAKTDQDRWLAWFHDSTLYAIRFMRLYEKKPNGEDRKLVFRALLQMAQYYGQLGGCWPGVMVHDAYMAIQQWLEEKLDPR